MSRMSAAAFMAGSFHNHTPASASVLAQKSVYVDSRSRVVYALPNGDHVRVIHDHGDRIRPTVSFQLVGGIVVVANLVDASLAWTVAS